MMCVGGSVAVSGELAGGPKLTAEALRYAMACLTPADPGPADRTVGLVLPRGRDRGCGCVGMAASGLVLFNMALVAGLTTR